MKQTTSTEDQKQDEETGIFLIGSNMHNASFSKLLLSKIPPKDVQDRRMLDLIQYKDKALVAFLVKDNMILVTYVTQNTDYSKDLKKYTTLINTTQESKSACLENFIIRDFSFGVQSLDGVVRLCVLLESPDKKTFVCRIFVIGTNLTSVQKLHTVNFCEPLVPEKFRKVVLNWDYDQLILFGTSDSSDERYVYLNVAIKGLGRFSKSRCIKFTQTPALKACHSFKTKNQGEKSSSQLKVHYSIKDFEEPAGFLFPVAEEGLLGKRAPIESEKDEQAISKPKAAPGPAPRAVTEMESLNRGNWSIALTVESTDFVGTLTLGNIGIHSSWRNFREPKADLDSMLENTGFNSIEFVRQYDPKKQTFVANGKVAMIQSDRQILQLNLEQYPLGSSSMIFRPPTWMPSLQPSPNAAKGLPGLV